jgi:RimJ/RimL family protein N-acetyltransferase
MVNDSLKYRLVQNEEKYWEFIRKLRNDDEIQKGFIEKVQITSDQQKKYMSKYNDHYYVCIISDTGEPAGYVGSIDNDIRVAVSKDFQRMGVGKFMINQLMSVHPESYAKVFHDNEASIRLFRSCGFKEVMHDSKFRYFKKDTPRYKQTLHNPYKIVKMFEEEIADYTGAPYAVAVDSCTNALFLACMYHQVKGKEVILPKRTYLSVPMSVIHAGGVPVFRDYEWSGIYKLEPFPIIDAAKRLTSDMFIEGYTMCLSFHIKKTLGIGKGGMILTDDPEAVEWFKKARYEGRSEKAYKEDNVQMLGWNMYMTPQQAAHGLALMQNYPMDMPDLSENNGYKDLTENDVFKDYKVIG